MKNISWNLNIKDSASDLTRIATSCMKEDSARGAQGDGRSATTLKGSQKWFASH